MVVTEKGGGDGWGVKIKKKTMNIKNEKGQIFLLSIYI